MPGPEPAVGSASSPEPHVTRVEWWFQRPDPVQRPVGGTTYSRAVASLDPVTGEGADGEQPPGT